MDMTREGIAEKAVYFKHNGYNCAQAVVKALAEANGMEDKIMMSATAGFAVGMGTMETTCGALIGANLMIGTEIGGNGTLSKSKELFQKFSESCGATICKDLKGRDTGVMVCSCDNCVRNAVISAIEVLGTE